MLHGLEWQRAQLSVIRAATGTLIGQLGELNQ